MKKFLLLVILIVFGVSISVVIIEISLRLIGFEYHLYPKKIQFGYPRPEHFETLYQPDKERFWVRRDYFKKLDELKDKAPEIVLMGDSCTEFGNYDEFLRSRVKADFPDRDLKIEKVGHGGWSSAQGLKQMELDIAPLKPKVATVYFGWNDHWIGFGIEDKNIAKLHSSLYVKLEGLRTIQLLGKGLILFQSGKADKFPLRVSKDDFGANLAKIVRIARAAGIRPMLLTAPSSHELGKEPKYLKDRWIKDLSQLVPLHRSYVEVVREIAATQAVPLCDLYAEFEQIPFSERRERYFNSDGIHLTKEPGGGYDLLAGMLLECLKRESLL